MSFTSVSYLCEREISVVLEKSNVAVAEGPLGTVIGVQFPDVFQSPLTGLAVHVELPAKLMLRAEKNTITAPKRNSRDRKHEREEGLREGDGTTCVVVFSFSWVLINRVHPERCRRARTLLGPT